jgi:hypothetical protein
VNDLSKLASPGAADKLMELVLKAFGPSVEQFGLIGGDLVGEIRWNNLRRIAARMQKKLEQAERKPKTIPPRLLVPILQSASVEDDDTLQEMWAGLLATASQERDKLSPSFAETLKQLTPDEARYFDKLYRFRKENARNPNFPDRTISPLTFSEQAGTPRGVSAETFERLGLIGRDYGLTQKENFDEMDVGYLFKMTDYAMKFMKACHADFHIEPRPEATQKKAAKKG